MPRCATPSALRRVPGEAWLASVPAPATMSVAVSRSNGPTPCRTGGVVWRPCGSDALPAPASGNAARSAVGATLDLDDRLP